MDRNCRLHPSPGRRSVCSKGRNVGLHSAPESRADCNADPPTSPPRRTTPASTRGMLTVSGARRARDESMSRRRVTKLYQAASAMVTRTRPPMLVGLSLAVLAAVVVTASTGLAGGAAGEARRAHLLRMAAALLEPDAFGPRLLRGLARLTEPWWVRVAVGVYFFVFGMLLCNHRAQTWLIYLHWLRPPLFVSSPASLHRHGLSGFTRMVEAGHLRGWHLLPSGPPFATNEGDYERALRAPNARIIIFFHGNSGTRAFPPKRVRTLCMLSAHCDAHVVSFDYSGFGDSGGRPSEKQLYADARVVYAFVRARVDPSARIFIYGQSLGTFAAVDLAAHLSRPDARDRTDPHAKTQVAGVVLEAPPASLTDAARSHPSAAPFRIVPGVDLLFRTVLKEELNSLSKVGGIAFPLLIMHGREDGFIPLSQGRKLFERAKAQGNAHASLVVFPHCGHINVAAQGGYLATLHEFLERYTPRA